MAITFDTINKVILLDSFNVSASDIWTAWVDWVVVGDNAKYDVAFSQIGGVAPVALYLYLENGWKVRPKEANGITTISGNLLVRDGSNAIASTIGNWQVLVSMETPISAQAIEVNTGSGVTAQDKADIISGVWANVSRTLTEAVAGGDGATAQEIWEYSQRELTNTSTGGLDESEIHAALDTYVNKDDWKEDAAVIRDTIWSELQ